MKNLVFKWFGMAGMALLITIALTTEAKGAALNINWTGSGGFSLTGMFSFNDIFNGTGPLNETQLDSLMITGFQNGAAIGQYDMILDGLQPFGSTAPLNFNFDTTTLQFPVGGFSTGPTGQIWGQTCNSATRGVPGFGFNVGAFSQALCLNGFGFGGINLPQFTLVAISKPDSAPIPEPGTLLLLGSGIVGMGAAARRRNRQR